MDSFTFMAMVDRAIGSAVLSATRTEDEIFKAQFSSDREAVIDALAALLSEHNVKREKQTPEAA